MTVLNELRASGGAEMLIWVLELQCDSWAAPFVLCNGYLDRQIITEDGRRLTALATGMDVAFPKKDKTTSQTIQFAIDNIRGDAVRAKRLADRDGAEIRLTYREYISTDLTAPADNPLHFIVRSFQAKGPQVNVIAGYFDLIDMAFPRDLYDSAFAPGLKYYTSGG